jgi:hypothetical membrane protein
VTTHVLRPIAAASERTGSRSRWRHDRVVSGVLLFALAAQFMTAIMLAASVAPDHDPIDGAISDLGVIPSSAALFNVSLVVTGLLNLVAGYLLYRSHRRRWVLVVFTLAALGAAGAGIVPLDVSGAHGLFALLGFVCFNLEPLALGALVKGPMRVISYLAAVVGLLFVAVMVVGDAGDPSVFGAIGHGGAERMIVYPVMLWMMALGGYLMAGAGDAMTGDTGDQR